MVKCRQESWSSRSLTGRRSSTVSPTPKFRLVKDDDAVKGLSADLSGLQLDHGRIYLNQASAVSVFSLKGQRVEVPASVLDRLTVLDVSALPAGVYVIKTDRTSFKFVKK